MVSPACGRRRPGAARVLRVCQRPRGDRRAADPLRRRRDSRPSRRGQRAPGAGSGVKARERGHTAGPESDLPHVCAVGYSHFRTAANGCRTGRSTVSSRQAPPPAIAPWLTLAPAGEWFALALAAVPNDLSGSTAIRTRATTASKQRVAGRHDLDVAGRDPRAFWGHSRGSYSTPHCG